MLPILAADTVVAIDGKTRRRSGKVDATPLHLVSAFAAGATLVLGQRATAAKSNEKIAIPQLLATLVLEGGLATLNAMGTQTNIAQVIRNRGADYVPAVKDNPHSAFETIEKNHGRIEEQRCFAFDPLDGLAKPEQWPDLKSFAVIEPERSINGKTSREQRFYAS